MPYIKKQEREEINKGRTPENAGELHYQLYNYFVSFLPSSTFQNDYDPMEIIEMLNKYLGKNPNYQKYNDISGVLIRCYKEVLRRTNLKVDYLLKILDLYDAQIEKYEDQKIIENGDVPIKNVEKGTDEGVDTNG